MEKKFGANGKKYRDIYRSLVKSAQPIRILINSSNNNNEENEKYKKTFNVKRKNQMNTFYIIDTVTVSNVCGH